MRKFGRLLGWCGAVAGVVALLGGGCAKDSGSKEFIPGKGWKSTQQGPPASPLYAHSPK